MFEYGRAEQAAAQKLDEYNLMEILNWCYNAHWRDPWDIRQKIIIEHDELYDALSNLSEDEFMEYLKVRYNVRFQEVISYCMENAPTT